MGITVLYAGGIGESGDDDTWGHPVTGMMTRIPQLLDPDIFTEHIWVPWRDQYGPVPTLLGSSYRSSLDSIEMSLRYQLSKLEWSRFNPRYLLIGYSAGAHALGNIAQKYGDTFSFAGFAGIADPARPPTLWPAGYGITGPRQVTGMPVWQVANPNDMITSCPPNSPLRLLPDVTKGFSITDLESWGQGLANQVWQEWWKNPTVDWGSCGAWLAGYLAPYPWGQHTGYDHMIMPGTEHTYIEWLCDQLNRWDWS